MLKAYAKIDNKTYEVKVLNTYEYNKAYNEVYVKQLNTKTLVHDDDIEYKQVGKDDMFSQLENLLYND